VSEILLDTDDLREAEAALSSLYAGMRLSATPDPSARFRISETGTGPLTVHELDYGADFRYDAEPFDRLVLCQPHSGGLDQHFPGRPSVLAGPDAVVTVGAVGLPFSGLVHRGRFSLLVLEPESLGELIGPQADEAVRLTSAQPRSAAANRHLISVIAYVREVAASALTEETPLLAGEIRRHVTATILATFPNTAHSAGTTDGRRDSTPPLLRRAIAFIDDNVARDISLADIAASVHVTPRALQYMFRNHRDTTPLGYLRRARLHQAHLELLASDPAVTTVSAIARTWGFGHAGRFSAFHRRHYGESPFRTLRAH
jgi:AraC-like DNA-binding protein